MYKFLVAGHYERSIAEMGGDHKGFICQYYEENVLPKPFSDDSFCTLKTKGLNSIKDTSRKGGNKLVSVIAGNSGKIY